MNERVSKAIVIPTFIEFQTEIKQREDISLQIKTLLTQNEANKIETVVSSKTSND